MAASCNQTSPPLKGFRENLTGAVLAGGHSSRFGSNKALQPLGETTFLGHAIDTLRPLCQEVVISAAKRNANDYVAYGVPVITDDNEDCGPLGGITTLLRQCATPWLLILTCDMPWLTTASLQLLLAAADNYDAVAFEHSPLPLLIRSSALPAAEAQLASDRLSIKALLHNLNTHYIIRCSEHELANVNHLADLPRPAKQSHPASSR